MTRKEILLELVEHLPDEQVEVALNLIRQLTPADAADSRPLPVRELPAFVGAGDSGRSDISQRVDDVLAEDGFGQQ